MYKFYGTTAAIIKEYGQSILEIECFTPSLRYPIISSEIKDAPFTEREVFVLTHLFTYIIKPIFVINSSCRWFCSISRRDGIDWCINATECREAKADAHTILEGI